MPQFLIFVLLLVAVVIAAYFYWKRAQARSAAGQTSAPVAPAAPSDEHNHPA